MNRKIPIQLAAGIILLLAITIGIIIFAKLPKNPECEKVGYVINNNKIFYCSSDDWGSWTENEVIDADRTSFEVMGGRYSPYAKDKSDAYYEGKKIPDSNPETFKVLENSFGPMASDKNHVYLYGNIVGEISDRNPTNNKIIKLTEPDPATFKIVDYHTGVAKDKNNVYLIDKNLKILSGVDVESFEVADNLRINSIFKDKNGYYEIINQVLQKVEY